MTLRKITIDNSVRYIPKNEKTQETDIKPKKEKLVHSLVNKTKIFHRTIKSFLKKYQQVDLEYLQSSMYMYKNIYNSIIIHI